MLNYFTTSTVAELLCFICAFIFLIKDKSTVWQLMIVYLLITCITEFTGIYITSLYKLKLVHTGNNWLYNIFLLNEAGFTNLMFAHLFSKYIKGKPIILIGLALFALCYIIESIHTGFFVYNENTYTLVSVQFALYSFYYYYLLIRSNEYIVLKNSPEFWWVAGALFFYFGNTVCNLFENQLDTVRITANHRLTYFIFKVLNVILYSFWSYSFICRKWQAKSQN